MTAPADSSRPAAHLRDASSADTAAPGWKGPPTPSASSLRRRKAYELRDVILGGQDGLVNILGIVLGVIAGGGSRSVLLAAGFAAAITESISMGAVGYTSSVAQRDYYTSEATKQSMMIDTSPDEARSTLRDIYARKGFTGALLEQVVDTLSADRSRWVDSVMDEGLHLQPLGSDDIIRTSVVITVATLVGHLIPLAPFLWLPQTAATALAVGLSALVLFAVGVYSALTLVGDWRRSGAKMLAIGLGAAAIGFVIGRLFHAAIG